ncbi:MULTISPECIES: regulatory protein RecX [Thalassotalea]|uniref:regulatory protein RecX n=1 Tax=Thalassotalea TaxID=1518149 RepID=UPI0015881FFF|nr:MULTISPECIES: regulatory protein RecX [Thalassotalea]
MIKEILHTGIDLLSRREHSKKELLHKLLQRGHEPDDIVEVIEFLESNQYLCEQRFTESVFRSRVNKGYGEKYIEQELMQKGIDSSLVNQVAAEMSVDWQEIAAQVYDKKFGNTPIKDDKNKAKRIRFMQYRGFSSHEIFALINAN